MWPSSCWQILNSTTDVICAFLVIKFTSISVLIHTLAFALHTKVCISDLFHSHKQPQKDPVVCWCLHFRVFLCVLLCLHRTSGVVALLWRLQNYWFWCAKGKDQGQCDPEDGKWFPRDKSDPQRGKRRNFRWLIRLFFFLSNLSINHVHLRDGGLTTMNVKVAGAVHSDV